MLKKNLYILFLMLVLGMSSVKCFAAEEMSDTKELKYDKLITGDFIKNGYTEDGFYYEVYGMQMKTRALESIYVTRTVVYEGVVQPESTMHLKEYIDGVAYSGTLNLVRFAYNYDAMTTTAEYEGILTKRIE